MFWKSLAKSAGLVSIAVGVVVLIGWLLDSAVLKSVHPSLVAMKANTAVGFCLSGWALCLKSHAPATASALWRRIGQTCAGTVALLGLLTLLEFISGASLGIDQLLFQEAPGAIGTLAPGRMAPASALCFLFIGLALLVKGESRQGGRLVFTLVGLVAVIAVTAGLTFLYASPQRSGLGYYIQMAVHTVLLFLVLAAGMLCLTPDRGLIALLRSRGTDGVVTRRVLPVAIILPIILEHLKQAGMRVGFVEAQFGAVLVDVAFILVFVALIVWLALSISRADSERKQAEEAWRLADRVFHSAVEGIAVTDVDGNIVAVNPAFEAITGYNKVEVLGKNPRLLQSGRQDQAFYRDLWAGLLASGQWRGELWNRRKGGEAYPEWLTLSTVKDAQGRTTHYVGVFSDISSVKQAQQQIEFLTYHDALTHLPNRALLKDRLNQGLQRAQREDNPLALLYLGLDHFKHINETLGHSVGDAVLEEMAGRLMAATRAVDTLARLGGDEFVLLLEGEVVAQQIAVARKLLELFTAPLRIAGHELAVTASIGISVYPADGTDADTLLQHADQAMHNAKAAGRNTYRFFDAVLSAGVLERLRMEKVLRSALADNQLVLHYQPQVDLYSGEIVGLEALLRWQHPDKGLLPPGEFIAMVEETNLIAPIGAWVLQAACRQLKAWHAAGHAGLRVAINVSALQFTHGALVESLAQVLRDVGLDGRYVELELHESLVIFNFDKTQALLRQLKTLGVWLAIDNFGLGHSSLRYLKHFPIDKLKIDKSFIGGIVTDPDDASMVQAIIAMGHGLGLKVVAEGVETEAQMGYLRTLHCDEIQGFHLSHALPAEEIPALLAAQKCLATSSELSGGRVLLLVDDEANVLSALKRLLHRDGYQILTAAGAKEGLELLAQHKVGVVLSDHRMPGMSGTEFLSRVKVMYPDIIRMVLSGYTDVNSITEAINRGEVYKFLTKPWEDEPLRAALKEAFMRYETSQDTPGATDG